MFPIGDDSSASRSSSSDLSRRRSEIPPPPPIYPIVAESSKPKVSSACDSCKRRKVRCTGSQPCERCIASGVTCTYGSSAGRIDFGGSTTQVSYTKHLEEKVAELQALLRQQPHLSDDHAIQVQESQERARNDLIDMLTGPEDDHVFISTSEGTSYHSRFAGLSMLRTVRDLCTTVSASETPADLSGKALAEAFDSTMLDLPSHNRMAQFALLPSRERLQSTIAIALDQALACKECVNRVQLDGHINRLYDRDPEDYSQEDRRCLGLLYALMALGRRHEPDNSGGTLGPGADMIVLKGVTYFRAARSIVDTTDCHDLNSIRALIAMASYLMSSSMISKAYAYVCTAAAASLRMGLHVSSASLRGKFPAADLTERRQVFAVLNLLDTYVSSTLGMPNILRDADPDQMVPCPEEEMYDLGESFVRREPLSPISETILACKLFRIQAKILQGYFPMSSFAEDEGKHQIEYQHVADRAAELKAWHQTLPAMPPATVEHRVLRSQFLLRLFYTSVEISLYRPFLHHVVKDKRERDFNYQGYAFGSECLRAATEAVWLIGELDQHNYLHEAQWFMIYTLAVAASSLSLFVLGTREGPTVDESRAVASKARELLSKLAAKNVSARRCYESLSTLPEGIQVPPAAAEGASPRTQFMMGIGAIDPAILSRSGAGGEEEAEMPGSGMSTSD